MMKKNTIFPNPAQNETYITTTGIEGAVIMNIYNMGGLRVWSKQLKSLLIKVL